MNFDGKYLKSPRVEVNADGAPTLVIPLDVEGIKQGSPEWKDAFQEAELPVQEYAKQHPGVKVRFVNLGGKVIAP